MTVNDAKGWLDWLKSLGFKDIGLVALILVLIYLIRNPEKGQVWKGKLQSLLFFSTKSKKASITNRVSGSFKHAIRKASESERAIYPDAVRISWIDGENESRESFLDGKQVIVRMSKTENINKITSVAAIEMAKTGVLTNGKRYMTPDLVNASDYLIARKLVSIVSQGQSLGYFDEQYFRPLYDTNSDFKECFDKLLAADKNGMFISVYLNEIRKMSETLFPEPSNKEAEGETISFLNFVYSQCKQKRDSFRYQGSFIKVDVAFTGDSSVLIRCGHDFYVQKCNDAFIAGISTVYLFSYGKYTCINSIS